MTRDDASREPILALAADVLDGTATDADIRSLEGILQDSPEARADYLAFAFIHAQLSATPAACGTDRLEREWLRQAAAAVIDAPPVHQESLSTTVAPPLIVRIPLVAAAAVFTSAVCLTILVTVGVTALPGRRQADPAVSSVPEAHVAGDQAGTRGSYYDDRELPIATVAFLSDGPRADDREATPANRGLSPTTLRSPEPTDLKSVSGAAVHVDKASVFGVSTADSGALFSGGVQARVEGPDSRFSVVATNLRVVDLGTEFRVDRLDDDEVAVTVLDGEVEVQSRVRLPVCYWPFDKVEAGRAIDAVSGLEVRLGASCMPCAGIVGGGALRFDNSADAAATVAGGTGEQVGTGLLAFAEGISIEAVIVSRWSGAHADYDEIYRKEDGTSRVLLSFQNDSPHHADFSEPSVQGGPCLSFGLHLAGRGYRELDMPLDGRDGRPALAEITDGRPHHVVATFDSFTGRKTIFIDGVKRFEHDYPMGTLVSSGGPSVAVIGNHGRSEPFHGVIDELAIYDFAVTADEVAAHHAHVRRGETYFGAAAPQHATRWQAVTRVTEGQTRSFSQRTGLPR